MRIWLKKKASGQTVKLGSFLARLRRDSRGNTLAMAAAALVPIAGMIGSGLDMSRAYMAQAKLQNACDASALAARRDMSGETWTTSARAEGERFFDFNFPSGTMNAQNITRTVAQSTTNGATVNVTASADVPTTVMSLFGRDSIPINVECDANQDYGNNDIMVVLDVTGSMNRYASGGGGRRIDRLRNGAAGLYRALAGSSNTRTRYGLMPYSVTVNVGRSLQGRDILDNTQQWRCAGTAWYPGYGYYCSSGKRQMSVNIASTPYGNIDNWRVSGDACVEERPSYGNTGLPILISTTVTRNDIDRAASSNSDTNYQWGRYDPDEIVDPTIWYTLSEGYTGYCPSEATKLRTYSSASAFTSAVNTATARVGGNTYHDTGIIWAARFLSSTGIFASDNPETYDGVPVAKHIVFLTDGQLVVTDRTYSMYGIERYYDRLRGSGSLNDQHIDRFLSACSTAKSMGMTIWVIALDVGSTTDISPCATSSGHFYTSDGSDLEDVFEQIGAGIGRLRLTQ